MATKEEERHDYFRQLAKERWAEDGECEIDDNAPVSIPDDASGAYVQAWVWVDDEFEEDEYPDYDDQGNLKPGVDHGTQT